ncbi:class I SAM-dependent methyltransferase [Ornithinibacillus salinisoli]|uniref:Class I SAM-dependent methyltransferase n=1 Tax=Ornithinibacillus salinisoli TaxID=1848459 RepID=A0ABW4VWA2_9BACI
MNSIKNDLVDSYNKQAIHRDKSFSPDWKKRERNYFLKHLYNNNKRTLLEIGAGTGKDSLFFKENGLDTRSIDISPEMIKLCKSKGLHAEVMSFDSLDFPNNHFDAVWALNCLLHVPKKNLPEVLAEISRVLKPTGLIFIGIYGGKYFEGVWEEDSYEPKRFFSFYDHDSIKEVLTEFFDIEYFQVIPASVVGGSLDFQSIMLRNRRSTYEQN